MDRLLVATRKGLFTIDHSQGKTTTELIAFEGDPVTQVLPDSRDGSVYAGLNLGHFGAKMHHSADGGKTWEEVGVPKFPEGGDDAPSLKQIWALETSGPKAGELWAGTIPGGLFHSKDGGKTWDLNTALWDREERSGWFGGGYDDPGIHSVCVDPRDSNRVLVGISCGGAWLTEDGGKTWENRAKGMFAAYMPEDRKFDLNIQDPHRITQCPGSPDHYWTQHHNGIFRSRNNLESWEHVPNETPSDFGFAVAVHPTDPETAWFVPAQNDSCRVPVDGKVVVTRTRDGGKSFEVLREGLPQENAFDLIYRHAFALDASGKCLAMGSTTGSLWVSENSGDSWTLVNGHLPPIYEIRFA
jgi:photosystem II stability/assembly factor-like uncharacterized protein